MDRARMDRPRIPKCGAFERCRKLLNRSTRMMWRNSSFSFYKRLRFATLTAPIATFRIDARAG